MPTVAAPTPPVVLCRNTIRQQLDDALDRQKKAEAIISGAVEVRDAARADVLRLSLLLGQAPNTVVPAPVRTSGARTTPLAPGYVPRKAPADAPFTAPENLPWDLSPSAERLPFNEETYRRLQELRTRCERLGMTLTWLSVRLGLKPNRLRQIFEQIAYTPVDFFDAMTFLCDQEEARRKAAS